MQMETTIKQAEEDRNRALEEAKHVYEEYRPMKEQVDSMRIMLGLSHSQDLGVDESKLTPEYVSFLFF